MKLENLNIVVTGASGNFGVAITHALKESGATVIGIDMVDSDVENYFKTDLKNEAAVEKTIALIIEQYGKIHVLINNAGSIFSKPIINITNPNEFRHSYSSFKDCVESNLDTTFITSSIVIEKMVKSRTKGLIINMSSISANGNAGQSAYAAAKAAVIALTKTWSKELGVFGIRSVAIAPGYIDTASTSCALNEGIINHVKKNTPLRKLGDVSSIVSSIKYAIENDFLNGAVLEVDGGLTI